MSKHDKLLLRLLSMPKDFNWRELVKVMEGFGYRLAQGGKTGGSRVRFLHTEYPPVTLHKPHPRPILKRYQLNDVIKLLKREGLL
jgi:hypothetical protein